MDFPSVRESRDEVKHGKSVLYIAAIVVRRGLFVLFVLLARSEDDRITKSDVSLGKGSNLRAETAIGLKPPLAVIKASLRTRSIYLSLVLDLDSQRFD